mmetsp:Transcript_29330/g.67340  ORF Transcript_29330/g.67340 Transcript_29330/m.67340 type:complete len:129 (+) Transcript_29330:1279-1665(+)
MGRTHFNQQEVSPEEIFKMFFGGGVGPMGGMGGGVHMGPGFRVYSTGFGGPQFRSARQQPQQGQPQRQQEQFSWQSLIQASFQFIFHVSFWAFAIDLQSVLTAPHSFVPTSVCASSIPCHSLFHFVPR